MADFTWAPDRFLKKSNRVNTLEAKFGEGYSQRTTFGINNNTQSWNLQFKNRSLTDASAIVTFLELKTGVTSFSWLPPGDSTEVRVICKTWDESWVTPDIRTLTATFTRVYET